MSPPPTNERTLLADPIAFWEARHAALDEWRSGGDRGLTPAENQEFYAWRLGKLLELIRRHAGADRPLCVLDAGCGKGHFTDGLRRCGHRVVGIDASATAIARARESFGGELHVCTLDGFRPRLLFDVVVCIDVLFHVLDDALWRSSVAAFARYAAAESIIVLTDTFPDRRYAVRDYIVHRAGHEYDELLAEHDFVPSEHSPYPFYSNRTRFVVYRRSCA